MKVREFLMTFIVLPFFKSVELGGMRVEAKDQTRPGRIADRDIGMCLGKRHPAIHQALHVWRLRLGMAPKCFNIIIEIITNNQDDLLPVKGTGEAKEEKRFLAT
ncbi:MAG: hypothetical protein OSB05_08325 [Akkermansiaceae bacterium]|nr:hypothetical protein [Akkermansiaceae bacterium]